MVKIELPRSLEVVLCGGAWRGQPRMFANKKFLDFFFTFEPKKQRVTDCKIEG